MKKSDLCQIANLIDERLDVKFDEKLKNFATKDDLKLLATKDDLKNLAIKDDLEMAIESIGINTNKSFEEFEMSMNERFEKVLTRDDFYNYMDDKALEVNIDKLKYLHTKELKNLPNRKTIKETLIRNNL